jgi:hypothetical protein
MILVVNTQRNQFTMRRIAWGALIDPAGTDRRGGQRHKFTQQVLWAARQCMLANGWLKTLNLSLFLI